MFARKKSTSLFESIVSTHNTAQFTRTVFMMYTKNIGRSYCNDSFFKIIEYNIYNIIIFFMLKCTGNDNTSYRLNNQ